VAIPADRNVTQKKAEKKQKYDSLCTETEQTCNTECMVIPVLIAAIDMVTKGLKNILENIQNILYKRQLYL
jgi:hypothetical protein